jgi:hypothetical protein
MTSRKTVLVSAVSAVALAGSAFADTGAELDALKARIAQLEAQQSRIDSAENHRIAVDQVMADAQKRSTFLMAEGMTAGYDDGFFLAAADGSFKLQPWLQFQFRHVTNFANTDGALNVFDDDAVVDDGFEIRRLKLGFKGHAITPDLTYAFTWATNRSGGGLSLETAMIKYMFSDTMGFKVGQWKDGVHHEEATSSGKQLAVDRSLVNEVLGGGLTDYVQGAALVYKQDNIRGELAFHDGANSDNTNFRNSSSNFGISARAEFLASGDWKAYEDFSAMGNTEDLLVIGAGFNWTQAGDADVVYHSVDAQWENTGGLGLYAAYYGIYTDGGGDDTYDWGALVQAGYLLPDSSLEPFARVGLIWVDDDSAFVSSNNEDYFTEITVGANYYLRKHHAKVTVDVTFLPDGSPADASGVGIGSGLDEQVVIRGQFQLML